MQSSRNPAKSRPLSANVKRLMQLARASPQNPDVIKVSRPFTERDLAYCDMQGNIFMAAVDRGIEMSNFAPMFMNSQLAGIVDYSFSCAGGMEKDDISTYLRMPILLQSPGIIVDTVLWLSEIVGGTVKGENVNMAVVEALATESQPNENRSIDILLPPADFASPILTEAYEYAYWLGYIYRCECQMHDESSRMVYGAFNEGFMKDFYGKLSLDEDASIVECAPEICKRLDALLIGKLWKKQKE